MDDNPGQRVFQHWDLVNRLAEKRFRHANHALEATDYVLSELQREDWARIRKHSGEGSFRGYLFRVVQRLLHDFGRKKFGRQRRPPGWLDAYPPFWRRVFQHLCAEGQKASDVIQILQDAVPGERAEHIIREAITTIRTRVPDCGQQLPRDAISIEGLPETRAPEPYSPQSGPGRAELLDAVYSCIMSLGDEADDELAGAVRELRARLGLDPEERLLLRMVYEDGMRVTEAGRLLGLSTNVAHGRLRRLLVRIDGALAGCGWSELLRDALEASPPRGPLEPDNG